MCGRVIQSSAPIRLAIVDGLDACDSRVHNYPPRWNSAPSKDLLVIRRKQGNARSPDTAKLAE
jgi:putative SOS response-associated peptidase YedK